MSQTAQLLRDAIQQRLAECVERYRRHKPASGQQGFHWVTVGAVNHHGGTAVQLDGDGKIVKGPPDLKGENVADIGKEKGKDDEPPVKRRRRSKKERLPAGEHDRADAGPHNKRGVSGAEERAGKRLPGLFDFEDEPDDRPDGGDDPTGDGSAGGEAPGDSRHADGAGGTGVGGRDGGRDHSVGNWRYPDREFVGGGLKTKFRRNVAAITVLRDMEAEGRDEATPEEQETLSAFTGWGQFVGLFNNKDDGWANERAQLKGLMSPDAFASAKETSGDKDEPAWRQAKRATLNSHFTAPAVVDAHWKAAQRLGFKGGRYLDPSIGSGYYQGMMPEELAKTTSVTGLELDHTTAEVAAKLYPSATIRNQGFETFQSPDGFFDLVASNVPFGKYTLHEKRYNRFQAPIHDHFFLKSIDKARPGGLVMHVTSTGTLDKPDDRIRKELASKADFVAAIRLPGKTHGKAANTEVVTDLIILRKHTAAGPAPEETPPDVNPEPGFTGILTDSLGRIYHFVDGKRVPSDHWTQTTTVPDPAGGEDIPVNQYFADNPDQVLGTIDRTGTMYQGNSPNVTAGEDFAGDLDAAIERLPEGLYHADDYRPDGGEVRGKADPDVKNNTLSVRNGEVFQYRNGAYYRTNPPEAHVFRIGDADKIRNTLRELISTDLTGDDSDALRGKLNEQYDAFVAQHGPLHEKKNINAMADDPDLPLLLSLEKYDKKEKTAEKADIFTKNTIRPERGITSADDVTSGLGVSLNERGKVDVEHIAELTGQPVEAVEDELRASGIAFEDPEHGWQSRAQYLSGNVRNKLALARAAAEHDKRFEQNVTALEAHQPEDIDAEAIGSKLGSPWVPAADMGAFAASLLNGKASDFSVRYIEQTGQWVAEYTRGGNRLAGGFAAQSWGTNRRGFIDLLDMALNNKSPKIYGDPDENGKKKLDEQATEDARGKIQDIKDEFREWLWSDEERSQRLHRYYNDLINDTRPMEYDGSHLSFPGMNPDWSMRPVQSNFVWQAITRGKGILGHEVGIGKTATMVAAAMEMRRLGLAKKPAIVVPKQTLEQTTTDAQELYPGARILSTTGMFDAKRRKETVSRIATGDYDIIIMSHDNLDMLPMSNAVQERFISEEIDELEAVVASVAAEDKGRKGFAVKALEKRKASLEARLRSAIDGRKDDQITFEETGIDQIFVDEAHKYKNLAINTGMKNLSGIDAKGAQKASNMLMRTRWLQEQHNGRGVVMATGTPISNSIAEMFNMQRYVQPEELESRGLTTFDAWANTFGEFETALEVDIKGDYKEKERFSRFVNIPELMMMGRQDLDVRRVDSLPPKILPDGTQTAAVSRPNRRDHMVVVPATDADQAMMASIRQRAAAVEGKRAQKGEDNALSILSDGRQGAVDVRLYDSEAEDHPDSKVNTMVRSVLERYHSDSDEHAGQTQLIFSDIGVHPNKSSGFHLYGDIIKKLVAGGIPRDQIADFGVLDGAPRLAAAENLRSGVVRVGIGGTDKLGTGLNVQTHLGAIHHLDVPYKPAYIEQRNGRAHRHGNQNESVDIHNYVSENPIDQMSWGIVSRKDAFIKQAVTDPKAGSREFSNEDLESLTPQQLMAAASGDTRIFDRLNLKDRVKTLRRAQTRHTRDQSSLVARTESATKAVTELGRQAEQITRDASDASKDFHATIDGQRSTERAAVTEHLEKAAQRIDEQEAMLRKNYRQPRPQHVGDVRGMKVYRHEGTYTLEGASGQKYVTGGSLLSIENIIRNLPKRAAKVRDEARQAKVDSESIKAQVGRPFSKAAELETAQKELAALEKELKHGKPLITPAAPVGDEPEKYSLADAIGLQLARHWIGFVEQYRRKPAAGQGSFKWNESEHPRATDGRFGDKAGEPATQKSLADLQKERKEVTDRHIWNNAMSKGSSRPAPPDASALDAQIRDAKEAAGKALWQRTQAAVRGAIGMPEAKHKQLVKDALEAGKSVPDNVLADYPDLDYKHNRTRAKAFKAWFGDWEKGEGSKVVNDKGEPQETGPLSGEGSQVTGRDGQPVIVYHGTASGSFEAFEKRWGEATGGGNEDNLLYGPGIYTTEDRGVATDYSKIKQKRFNGDKVGFVKALRESAKYLQTAWAKATREDGDKLGRAADAIESGEHDPNSTDGEYSHTIKMSTPFHVLDEFYPDTSDPQLFTMYVNIRKPWDVDKGVPDEIMEGLTEQQRVTATGNLRHWQREVTMMDENYADLSASVDNMQGRLARYQATGDKNGMIAFLTKSIAEDHAAMERNRTSRKVAMTYVDKGVGYSDVAKIVGGKGKLNALARKAGYDGITHTGGNLMGGGHNHRVWIAFEPNQIKAVDNAGTFDPSDDRMKYSRLRAEVERQLAESWSGAVDRYARPKPVVTPVMDLRSTIASRLQRSLR